MIRGIIYSFVKFSTCWVAVRLLAGFISTQVFLLASLCVHGLSFYFFKTSNGENNSENHVFKTSGCVQEYNIVLSLCCVDGE